MLDDPQFDDTFFDKDDEVKEIEKTRGELLKTEKRTPEQEEELKQLNSKRQGWYNKRVGSALSRERTAREEAERLREELAEERRNKKETPAPIIGSKTIKINGKDFFTDAALKSMVESGEWTQEAAQEHWQERNDERIVVRLKTEKQQESFQSALQDGVKKVLAKYPHFDPKHRDHDPKDPVYVKARDLMNKGMVNAWDAVEEAEEFVGKRSTSGGDRSDDLSVTRGSGPTPSGTKKIELTEWEQEQATRFHGVRINPKTGRNYTSQEAIELALRAKRQRQDELAASGRR